MSLRESSRNAGDAFGRRLRALATGAGAVASALVEIEGKHVVVTGGAGGIGSALAERFAADGASKVVVADFDREGAERVAASVDGMVVEFDAGNEGSVLELIGAATEANGLIDVFFSNAGIAGPPGGPEAPDEDWDAAWRVNVMSHVWAARRLGPEMRERDSGYLLNTASAAGLLTQVSALVYSATKSAAVALAEWLAVNHAGTGVKVSCLCPLGVKTPMLDFAMQEPVSAATMSTAAFLEPSDVAESVVEAMREERFLILPHPEVARYQQLKAAAPDKWIEGMRQLMESGSESVSVRDADSAPSAGA